MLLLCFAHAGAGAAAFRSWRTEGSGELTVIPVVLPGREVRYAQTPPREMDALLVDVLRQVKPLLNEPFAILGHSMGALVGFELTRLLRRHGLPGPASLFVSAFRAPHLRMRGRVLHALPEDLLKVELSRLDGTPTAVLQDPELLRTVIPALRADLEVIERYRYHIEPPLACPITCLGGIVDERVSRAELRAWREHTIDRFRLHLFPGGHFFIYRTAALVQRAIGADLGLSFRAAERRRCDTWT